MKWNQDILQEADTSSHYFQTPLKDALSISIFLWQNKILLIECYQIRFLLELIENLN